MGNCLYVWIFNHVKPITMIVCIIYNLKIIVLQRLSHILYAFLHFANELFIFIVSTFITNK